MESDKNHIQYQDYKATYEKLFREQFTPLCMFARKYINDLDVAKDIVHNVFIELWEKKESVDFIKSLKTYLFTAVHNRCLNYIRDNKKFTQFDRKASYIDEQESLDSTDNFRQEELTKRLNKALAGLPEKCREVFLLSRNEGLKYNDIASKLGISVKTVETHMTKALKMLREQLKDYLVYIIFWLIGRWLI